MSKNKTTNNESNNNWLTAIGVIIAVLFWWLIKDNAKKDNQIKSLQKERDHVKDELLQISMIIDESIDLTNEVKVRLNRLLSQEQELGDKVKSELAQAFVLVQLRLMSKALLSMAKIIEESLKSVFLRDQEFKRKYKQPKFVWLLEHAKETGLLDKSEYHYANGIRELRNEEAHSIIESKDSSWEVTSLLVAMNIIVKLEAKKPKGLAAMLLPPFPSKLKTNHESKNV